MPTKNNAANAMGGDKKNEQPGQKRLTKTKWLVGIVVLGLCGAACASFSGSIPLFSSSAVNETPEAEPSTSVAMVNLPSLHAESWDQIDDPSKDGWDTEAFHRQAKKQLKSLGKLLSHRHAIKKSTLQKLVADEFACQALLPESLTNISTDSHITVDRFKSDLSVDSLDDKYFSQQNMSYHGVQGIQTAIENASEPFLNATDVRFEFKVVRVHESAHAVATRQYFSISGKSGSGAIEHHATWDIQWTLSPHGKPPRIRSIVVREFEQVANHDAAPMFSDCTNSVMSGVPAYGQQFLRGMNHWFERIQDPSYFSLLGNPGIAIGDVNGDGLDDLYVCQESGLPNRLFIQMSDGSVTEQSGTWGVDWLDSSRSALLVDLDNDRDQDLVVAVMGGLLVAENDGVGHFQIHDVLPTSIDTMSVSAVDYDKDGMLDLHVCAYYQDKNLESSGNGALAGGAGFVFHDANNGGANTLFRNTIEMGTKWTFDDVTKTVGLDENNFRYSLAATWDDFDNDGDMDLYVANDFGRDRFCRNETDDQGNVHFVDASEEANVESAASGMSVTCGDYDRDGWIDLFVSNMFSSAGNRIAFQQQFKPTATDSVKSRYRRLARGNTLLKNKGTGTFQDQSGPAGIEMGRWAWGSHFTDFNNDGWEDIVVANGYITTGDSGDL